MREIRTLRLTWRGLETWPGWNCEPIPQSKERNWKPSTYSRRACPRPYLTGGGEETYLGDFSIWQRALPLPTKTGWYAVLADPQMPVTSTLLDQAHNAIERKLFMMKAFHHPDGSQQAFLTGLAHLYNLVPYQRRAQHAGQCGVEVEGGTVPTRDWFLNLQMLTSGGVR